MHTALQHSPAWHAAQEAAERSWLDRWARSQRKPYRPARSLTANVLPFVPRQRTTIGRA